MNDLMLFETFAQWHGFSGPPGPVAASLSRFKLLLGHGSLHTTERYLGTRQDGAGAQRRDQTESGG
jgi:hypothetical protein